MAAFTRYKITRVTDQRVPTDEKIGAWLTKEGYPFFASVRKIVNWLCELIGYVAVDSTDTPGSLETKLLGSASVVVTKSGPAGARVLTLTSPDTEDHKFSTDLDDETAGGADFALTKFSSEGNVKPSLDATGGMRRTRWDVTLPSGDPPSGSVLWLCNDGGEVFGSDQALRTVFHPYDYQMVEVTASASASIAIALSDRAVPSLVDWPAGSWALRAWVLVDDGDGGTPDGPGRVVFNLKRVDTDGGSPVTLASSIATGWSSSPDWVAFDLTIPVALTTGAQPDRIYLDATAETTSATPVAVNLGMGGEAASYLRTPFVAAPSGVAFHADFPDLATSGHPWAVIAPPIMATATVVNDLVTVPATTNRATVVAAVPYISGICKTGFANGQELSLFITNPTPASPVAFVDGADLGIYPTFANLSFETIMGDGGTLEPAPPTMDGPTWITFWFDLAAGCFRQSSKPITYVVPT